MEKRLSQLLIVAISTLAVVGCQLPEDGADIPPPPDQEAAEPVEPEIPATPAAPAANAEGEIGEEEARLSSVPTLKQPTDPQEFIQRKGEQPGREQRQDPFALFAIPSATPPTPPPREPEPEPTVTAAPEPAPEPTVAAAPSTPSQPAPPPDPVEPPPPPEPTLARAVNVTGVLELQGTNYALVRAPQEPSSRYVREGQYLSNNRVFVKSIDADAPNPVVILEEVGVEVIKTVNQET